MRTAALMIATAVLPALAAAPARADQYVMGAGQWNCGEVVRVVDEGTDSELGQLVGWVLGFWSQATYTRDAAFVDTVEKVGGRAIFEATVARCKDATPSTRLHIVAASMVANTK